MSIKAAEEKLAEKKRKLENFQVGWGTSKLQTILTCLFALFLTYLYFRISIKLSFSEMSCILLGRLLRPEEEVRGGVQAARGTHQRDGRVHAGTVSNLHCNIYILKLRNLIIIILMLIHPDFRSVRSATTPTSTSRQLNTSTSRPPSHRDVNLKLN